MERSSQNLINPPRKRLTEAGGNFERDLSVKILTHGTLSLAPLASSTSAPHSDSPIPNILTLEGIESLAFDDSPTEEEPEYSDVVTEQKNGSLFAVDFNFNVIEYTADENDYEFLQTVSRKSFTQHIFEMAMDRFEKIAAFCFWKTGAPPLYSKRPTIVNCLCDVCGGGDEARNNRLVVCYICHMAVHQECYGLPYFPLSRWRCRRCGINPTHPLKCIFCPIESGAIKFASNNHTVHQICAIWINGVLVSQNSFLEPIDIKEVVRDISTCSLCKITYGGVVVCATDDCGQKMHVTCAAIAGVRMETEIEMRGGRKFNRKVYCLKHSRMDKHQITQGIKRVMEALKKPNRRMPTDIRVRPIEKIYITPNYINVMLSPQEVNLLYSYWLIRRLKNYGYSFVPRVQILVDRIARPTRHLQNDQPGPLHQAFKNRVMLKPTIRGNLQLIGKFTTDFPLLNDDVVSYFDNALEHIYEEPCLNYRTQTIILHKQQIILDRIPVVDKDVELLFCRKKDDILRVVVDLVREYVDPTLEFDLTIPYSAADEICPWDIIGLMFYIAVPEHVQVTAFICGLWLLDPLGMFEHFDVNSDEPMNLKTISKRALHKDYSTLNQVYRDFHKMMLRCDTPHIQSYRKSYVNRFEEAVAYSMLPRHHAYVLQLLIDEIQAVGNKQQILLKYLMHELTLSENIDEAAAAMEESNREKLLNAAHYARSLIKAEKMQPIPNMELLIKTYQRRAERDKDIPFIILPSTGFSTMMGFRTCEIFEKVYSGLNSYPTISWSEYYRQAQTREEKMGVKVKKCNGVPQLVRFNKPVTRKRRIPVEFSRPAKSRKPDEKIISAQSDQIRSFKCPVGDFNPVDHMRVGSELIEDENPIVFNPRRISSVLHHDTFVILATSSKGKNVAARVIDPHINERCHPIIFQDLMALPNSKKTNYVCVKLFLNENITEWIPKSRMSVMNISEVGNYLQKNKDVLDYNQPSIQSFATAFKYYTEKLCM